MKTSIRVPFFEVGIKNYLYGDDVLSLALVAEEAAEKYDVDVLLIAPYLELRRVAERTRRIIIFAPYMDPIRPGSGMADVLPEAVKAAGAKGVIINHCERPMTLSAIKRTIDRANELDLISFACADTIAEAKAIAQLRPDIINPEPTELIGSGNTSDMGYVHGSIEAVKSVCEGILVEQAAGITTGEQVYRLILAGAEGVGAASGVCKAANPHQTLMDMVYNVRKAQNELQADRGREQ